MNTFVYAYIVLSPGKLSALFIILIEKVQTRSIVSWAIALPFFWEGCASIPFFCFSSLADRIKYPETPKYSEQYFREQESGTKVNIFLYLKC